MFEMKLQRYVVVLTMMMLVVLVWPRSGMAEDFGQAIAGWWTFDEVDGSTVADSSGVGNDGVLVGGVSISPDSLLGNALEITDPNGMLVVAHDVSLEPVTGTFQAWIKIPFLQDADIVSKTTNRRIRTDPDTPVGLSVYGLRIRNDGGVVIFIGNDDPASGFWTTVHSAPALLMPETWHHLAMRWDGNLYSLFVDGILQGEAVYDPVPGAGLSYSGTSSFYLGNSTVGPHGGEFIGLIDEVRFYGRARRDVEIFSDVMSRGHKPARPLN